MEEGKTDGQERESLEWGAAPERTPQALDCADLAALSPLGGLVHPGGTAASGPGEGAPHDVAGDKTPHATAPWPHAPMHKLGQQRGLFRHCRHAPQGQPLFTDKARRDLLERRLMELASQYHWQLEAWAVFANHYHIVARGFFRIRRNLGKFLKHLHSDTARELNRMDGKEGRKGSGSTFVTPS